MVVAALAFWFVAVCSPDNDICERENYQSWPRWGLRDGYDTGGPYFMLEDCERGRRDKPIQKRRADGTWEEQNPWAVEGESLCYAREISVTVP